MTSGRRTPIPLLGPLPGVVIGGALLVVGFLYGLVNLVLRDERRTIIVAAVFLCLCFFVLPTRVHERYLVPVFAIVPLLAVTSRAWLVALVALSRSAASSTCTPCSPRYGTDDIKALPLGDFAASTVGIVLSVLLVTRRVPLLRLAAVGMARRREPDGFALAAAEVRGTVDLGPVPETRAQRPVGATRPNVGPPTPESGTGGRVPHGGRARYPGRRRMTRRARSAGREPSPGSRTGSPAGPSGATGALRWPASPPAASIAWTCSWRCASCCPR